MEFRNAMSARLASASLGGLKRVVEAGGMLELQRALHAVGFADNDDERGCESFDFEILGEFVGIPDLAVRSFQGLPYLWIAVDLAHQVSSDLLGVITRWHGCLLAMDRFETVRLGSDLRALRGDCRFSVRLRRW